MADRQQRRAKKRLSRRAIAAGAAAALGTVFTAQAATITVDSLGDAASPATDTQCTLREALTNANDDAATFPDCAAGTGADTIDFSVTGTIVQASGTEFLITDDVVIDGPGSAQLTVQAETSGSQPAFEVPAGTASNVTLSGLKVTSGDLDAFESSEANVTIDDLVVTNAPRGIVVRTPGTFTITNSSFSGNTERLTGIRTSLYGTGSATISNVTISGNNSADLPALYLYAPGQALIANTVISGNTGGASSVDRDASIMILYGQGPVTIRDTAVRNNIANGYGQAAVFLVACSDVTIERSEISGNVNNGGSAGAGLFLYATNAEVVNTTIANNQMTDVESGGGGIAAMFDSQLTLRVSTVSGNSAAFGGNIFEYGSTTVIDDSIVANGVAFYGPDIAGTVTANYTLIEDPSDATINGANNITGQDPQLGTLQNNGGVTQTMKPAATSPAVNAGDPAYTTPAEDQRGFTRPVGVVDMGAVELQSGVVGLSQNAYSIVESGGTLVVTVNRTGGSDGPASVQYATSNGTATNADYTPASGTLNWSDGDTAPKTFNVTILDDALVEGDETFNVTLSNAAGASLGASAAVATIVDDDVADADLSVTKSVSGSGPFVVGGNVTFNIVVSNDGPATATNVTIEDVLPSGLTFVSASPSGVCSGTTTITCNVGTLADNASTTVMLTARITQAGAITNTATAASDQPDASPASDDATINAASPATIPTLSEWMLLALASALAALASTRLRS